MTRCTNKLQTKLVVVFVILVFTVILWKYGDYWRDVYSAENIRTSEVVTFKQKKIPSDARIHVEDVSNVFLVPTNDVLQTKSEEELLLIFWRYVNTVQVLCRNQMRHGVLSDGGKEVCIDEEFVPKRPCLVYSFGSALRFDFEKAIHRLFDCEIHTFDPSIKIDDIKRKKIPSYVHYHEIGLDGRDLKDRRGWTMRTLPTLVEELGHKNRVIDILKIDAEGGEWSGFQEEAHFKPLANVKQILIELHFGLENNKKHWGDVKTPNQLQVLRTFYDMGFRIFMREHTMSHIKNIDTVYSQQLCSINEISLINMKWKRNGAQ